MLTTQVQNMYVSFYMYEASFSFLCHFMCFAKLSFCAMWRCVICSSALMDFTTHHVIMLEVIYLELPWSYENLDDHFFNGDSLVCPIFKVKVHLFPTELLKPVGINLLDTPVLRRR